MFTVNNFLHNYNTRYSNYFKTPKCKLQVRIRSVKNNGMKYLVGLISIVLWNPSKHKQNH